MALNLPTMTPEAAELLTATNTVGLVPLIAAVEMVPELTLMVLANMHFGQIKTDRSTVAAYVAALSAADQAAVAAGEVSRMNPGDDAGFNPMEWAHSLMDLQMRAESMMTPGFPMGLPVSGGGGGGGGGGDKHDPSGKYETGRHTAMNKAFSYTFTEEQIACRSQQQRIKSSLIGESSWPSNEWVSYTRLRDASGGRELDTRPTLVASATGEIGMATVAEET